ncbi:MAG: hypothetical protein WB815_03720 [Nitrososphaeraceae archaeon]
MNRNIFLRILLTLLSVIICIPALYLNHTVYAHNFSITDDSALLTLTEQIKAETGLVNEYFLSNNNISAIEHAKNAANLTSSLDNKLRQSTVEDITQIYADGLYNSTTLALVVANLVDEILRSYGRGYGISYDLTNMTNMMLTMMLNNDNSSSDDSRMSAKNNAVPVNIYDYQTAKALSNIVERLFNDILSAQAPVNEKVTVDNLKHSIKDLKYAVDNNVQAEALMEIVHMKIHPMLQSAYDLKLVVR